MVTIKVSDQDEGVRLDRLLRRHFSLLSLAMIYKLMRTGGVRLNGKAVKKTGARCKEGDEITVAVDPAELRPARTGAEPERDLTRTSFFRNNFKIIYEDEYMLVCDKPAGLVVHGGTGHKRDTLIDLAVSHCRATNPRHSVEPVLVHRLDRDTSGVILLAKDKRLLRQLHEDLRSRELQKVYAAVCWGAPGQAQGTVDAAVERRFAYENGTKMHISDQGQEARSSWRVVRRCGRLSLLSLQLHTGRTHQLRVHCTHLGCPIVGDVRYGEADRDEAFFARQRNLRRLYLHSQSITFFYPPFNRTITFDAPEPASFTALLATQGAVAASRP